MDIKWENDHNRTNIDAIVVALAGPLVNVVLSAIIYPFARLTTDIDDVNAVSTISARNFLPVRMSINLWLALFNLIPAFPMNGGRVLRALLGFKMNHAKATRVAASVGQVIAMAFVFFGFFYNPILIFIGFFIFLGHNQSPHILNPSFFLKGLR